MRSLLLLPTLLAATPAAAHIGHLGTVAGHDHLTLAVGLVTITGAALVAWLKGGKAAAADEDTDQQADAEPAPEDQPA